MLHTALGLTVVPVLGKQALLFRKFKDGKNCSNLCSYL